MDRSSSRFGRSVITRLININSSIYIRRFFGSSERSSLRHSIPNFTSNLSSNNNPSTTPTDFPILDSLPLHILITNTLTPYTLSSFSNPMPSITPNLNNPSPS